MNAWQRTRSPTLFCIALTALLVACGGESRPLAQINLNLTTHGPALDDRPNAVSILPGPVDVPAWWEFAAGAPVGHRIFEPVQPRADDPTALTLRALGYTTAFDGWWQKEVDLTHREILVPSFMAELPTLSAIAVISTYRPHLKTQYIYGTLASLFAALPATAIINVFVGNDQRDYLHPHLLAQYLGEDRAARTVVIPTPPQTAQFFERNLYSVSAKATWNYARALRSHQTDGHLLLCEDDIVMAPDALSEVRAYLEDHVTDLFMLYNDRCERIPATWSSETSGHTLNAAVIRRNSDFPTTQAIVFEGHVAQGVGDYLMARAGREPYDWLIGRYLGPFKTVIGYVYPSVVQHIGYATTGLSAVGNLPMSGCFGPPSAHPPLPSAATP